MKLSKLIITEILAHAEQDYPRECCGVIVQNGRKQRYVKCRNTASEPNDQFSMSPEDYAEAEDSGAIIAIVHSHPDATTQPSNLDHAQCDLSQLPWIIASWPEGDIRTIMPTEGVKPLLERPFVHGIWDCYAIVRDWYQLERSITLPDFERSDGWWDRGENLYMKHYAEAGFIAVSSELQPGDVIIMQVRADEPNHAGVYVGNGEMVHHMHGQLSQKVPYGGYWLDRTITRLRYTGGKNVGSN
ncbi:C40 family peptidase [Pectobacterium carotovorum]|uniref:Peptidase P60 n=1 Tax=Pectobacterium carotovorum subsp. carotovorum TaxID=555 RepID=A0AAI9PCZ8_PECCC|nr:C40 family peptidase [Pectobacterium carotovorum]GKX46083.1 peptidase P60 [Pectobacterium carotovorum subsp. carotovorum]GLV68387.1 peptidase P60 [Pectobacterium carotovorum subsp. carotovorum]